MNVKLAEGDYFGDVRRRLEESGVVLSLTTYEPLQAQPVHTHLNPTFYIQLRGDHVDTLPQGSFEQPRLSVLYHPASVAHRSEVGPQGMAGVNIELSQSWLDRYDLKASTGRQPRLIDAPSSACLALRMAVQGFVRDIPGGLEDLVLELVEPAFKVGQEESSTPAWLGNAMSRLLDRTQSPESVTALAHDVGVHPMHLVKSVRRKFGRTVTSMIQESRLARAGERMLEGKSAGESALECGFQDQSYMARCFRKRLGLPPMDVIRLRHVANRA